MIAMPSLWAASLLLLFAVIAGGLACVEAVENGEYLPALAFAAITLTCAVGFAVPFVSRRVRQWVVVAATRGAGLTHSVGLLVRRASVAKCPQGRRLSSVA
jgi:hypothetical protein